MSAYVGRFAPSPTGPLHAGSVIAALGSHLEARVAGGQWRVRIDDLDPPRQSAEARDRILRQLEALGLEWDGPVLYQSTRSAAYAEAFDRLRTRELAYRCDCSRRQLARTASEGPLGRIYPGTCRERNLDAGTEAAWRLRLPAGTIDLNDPTQGRYALDADHDLGDPIVVRRDGIWSYHLSTTLDDVELGVTHVVRGADLQATALIQVCLQDMLDLPAVNWRHLPILVDRHGDKLSKQTGAAPIDEARPLPALLAAWSQLGQRSLPEAPASVAEFHDLARRYWDPDAIPADPIRCDP